MKTTLKLTIALIAGLGASAPALAQDAKAIDAAVKARKAQMTLYAYNLGLLGGMAKGQIEYNADAAQSAAAGLYALTQLDAARMWPKGSDNVSITTTRATPAMWENQADVYAKATAMVNAAEAMNAAAGTGVEGIQGAIGAVGGACGACHKAYRGPAS